MRSTELEKAAGVPVQDPGQRALHEHGFGHVTTWVGGIRGQGEMLLREAEECQRHHLAT